MASRTGRVSSAMRESPKWVTYSTLAVLALGAAGVVLLMPQADRRRVRLVEPLQPGADSSAVVQLLGAPRLRCETGDLAHLERGFPTGWNAAATHQAMEQLRMTTTQRWIFPVRGRESSCAVPGRNTEVGIDTDGRVLWLMPLPGRRPLRLPPSLSPATPVGALPRGAADA